MKVQIVIPEPELSWILGKIARLLVEHASAEDIEINVGPGVDPEADVNHYLPWWAAHGRLVLDSLLMVTHIEPGSSWEATARTLLPNAAHMTTMSEETKTRLVGWGISPDKITVAHVGVDQDWEPRPISIGLSYRIYRDGRKNEGILLELADSMDLTGFRFALIGTGWERIFDGLRERGVEVQYTHTEDYADHKAIIPQLDYWLYTGQWDEGPMGMLDALRCGVPCILPPHGYCVEAAPYAFFYQGLGSLLAIFYNIRAEKWRHRRAIDDWTWENYGKLHQELYRRVAGE